MSNKCGIENIRKFLNKTSEDYMKVRHALKGRNKLSLKDSYGPIVGYLASLEKAKANKEKILNEYTSEFNKHTVAADFNLDGFSKKDFNDFFSFNTTIFNGIDYTLNTNNTDENIYVIKDDMKKDVSSLIEAGARILSKDNNASKNKSAESIKISKDKAYLEVEVNDNIKKMIENQLKMGKETFTLKNFLVLRNYPVLGFLFNKDFDVKHFNETGTLRFKVNLATAVAVAAGTREAMIESSNNLTGYKDDEGVATIAGININEVDGYTAAKFRMGGLGLSQFSDTAGKIISKNLGIKNKKDTPTTAIKRINASLGMLGVEMLLEEGSIENMTVDVKKSIKQAITNLNDSDLNNIDNIVEVLANNSNFIKNGSIESIVNKKVKDILGKKVKGSKETTLGDKLFEEYDSVVFMNAKGLLFADRYKTSAPNVAKKDYREVHQYIITKNPKNASSVIKSKATTYNDFINTNSIVKEPSFEPIDPDRTISKSRDTYSDPTDKQIEYIRIAEATPNVFNSGMDILLENLDLSKEEDITKLKKALGYPETVDKGTVSKDFYEANESRQQRIDKLIEDFFDFYEKAKEKGKEGKAASFYFKQFLPVNNRTMIESTTVNPLSDKELARWLTSPENALVEIGSSKIDEVLNKDLSLKEAKNLSKEMKALIIGTVQAFDGNAIKEESVTDVEKDVLEDVLKSFKNIVNTPIEDLKELLFNGKGHIGQKATVIDALEQYQRGDVTIQSWVSYEVDGLTNALFYKLLQTPVPSNLNDDLRERVGVLPAGNGNYEHMGDVRKETTDAGYDYLDNYMLIADKFRVKLIDVQDKDLKVKTLISSNLFIVDKLEDSIKKGLRDFTKPGTMIVNYGAGIRKIIEQAKTDYIHGSMGNKGLLDNILNHNEADIIEIFGFSKIELAKLKKDIISKNKNALIKTDEYAKIKIVVDSIIGRSTKDGLVGPLAESLEEVFAPYIEISNQQIEIYELLYQNFVKEYNSALSSIMRRDNGVSDVDIVTASENQKQEAINKVKEHMPSLARPDNISSNNFTTIVKKGMTTVEANSEGNKIGASTVSKSTAANMNSTVRSMETLYSGLIISELSSPQAKSLPSQTHTHDGLDLTKTVVDAQKELEVLATQVFDAMILNGKTHGISKNHNENAMLSNLRYNGFEEALIRLMKNKETLGKEYFYKHVQEGLDFGDFLQSLQESYSKIIQGRKEIFEVDQDVMQMSGLLDSKYTYISKKVLDNEEKRREKAIKNIKEEIQKQIKENNENNEDKLSEADFSELEAIKNIEDGMSATEAFYDTIWGTGFSNKKVEDLAQEVRESDTAIRTIKGIAMKVDFSNNFDVNTVYEGFPEYNRLPSYKKGQKNMTYAGVGSRGTPPEILEKMVKQAKLLESKGYLLQTGNAKGADKAFRDSVKESNKKVFTPDNATDQTRAIAKEIHPAGNKLKGEALDLHARNTFQVFGEKLDTPVDFLLAYAKVDENGIPQGGTSQAIRLAKGKGIPVINMYLEGWEQKLEEVLNRPTKSANTTGTSNTNTNNSEETNKPSNAALNTPNKNYETFVNTFIKAIQSVKDPLVTYDLTTAVNYVKDVLNNKPIGDRSAMAYADSKNNSIKFSDFVGLLKNKGALANINNNTGKSITEIESFIKEIQASSWETIIKVHEHIHIGAMEFMKNNPNDPKTKYVNNLFAKVMKQAETDENLNNIQGKYWKKNVDEFIAVALSNPDMMNYLSKMKTGGTQSVLSKFVTNLLEMVGIKDNNEFAELLNNFDGMLNNEVEAKPSKPENNSSEVSSTSNYTTEKQKIFTVENVKNNPDKLFIFGDNLQQKGKGGQAVIRDEPNAFGVPTKKLPSMGNNAFFTDTEYENNVEAIDKAFEDIIKEISKRKENIVVVLPEDGIGTGLAKLEEKAPKTFEYLQSKLNKFSKNNKKSVKESELHKKLSKKLSELYPDIKVNYTNEDIEEVSDTNTVRNQKTDTDNLVFDLHKLYPNVNIEDVLTKYGEETIIDGHYANLNNSKERSAYAAMYVDLLEKTTVVNNAITALAKKHNIGRNAAKTMLAKELIKENPKGYINRVWKAIKDFIENINRDSRLLNRRISLLKKRFMSGTTSDAIRFSPKKGYSKVDTEKTFTKQVLATNVLKDVMSSVPYGNAVFTGSAALALQGDIYRKGKDGITDLHDLDIVVKDKESMDAVYNNLKNKYSMSSIYSFDIPTKSTLRTILDNVGSLLPKSLIMNINPTLLGKYLTATSIKTYIVVGKDHKVTDIIRHNDYKYSRVVSYNVRDKNNNIVGTYKADVENVSGSARTVITKETNTGVKAVVLDLIEDSTKNDFTKYESVNAGKLALSTPGSTFDAKNDLGYIPREKDVLDFNSFYKSTKEGKKYGNLKEEFKNKLILANSGIGKSYVSKLSPDIIDSDTLLATILGTSVTNLVEGLKNKDLNIVYSDLAKAIQEKLNEGYTVVTPSTHSSIVNIADIKVTQPDHYVVQKRSGADNRDNNIPRSLEQAKQSIARFDKNTQQITKSIKLNSNETLADILFEDVKLQKNKNNKIKGQANLTTNTILLNEMLMTQDTLPHEYAHFYINSFKDTDIVKEAIKKWGSEESLVQAIGEEVVKREGEAYNWWKTFSDWVKNIFNNLSQANKEELVGVLTEGFLTNTDLRTLLQDTKKDENKNNELSNKYTLFGTKYPATKGQEQAIDKIKQWYSKDRILSSTFLLAGRGGTGKTSVIATVANELGFSGNDVIYIAPTHSATKVLKNSVNSVGTFKTVASLIGKIPKVEDGKAVYDQYGNRVFEVVPPEDLDTTLGKAKIVVVDESSMLNIEDYNALKELVSTSKPIIYMGDVAQLPPIETEWMNKKIRAEGGSAAEARVFRDHLNSFSHELTEVTRQKEPSIITEINDYIYPLVRSIIDLRRDGNVIKFDPRPITNLDPNGEVLTNEGNIYYLNVKALETKLINIVKSSEHAGLITNSSDATLINMYVNDIISNGVEASYIMYNNEVNPKNVSQSNIIRKAYLEKINNTTYEEESYTYVKKPSYKYNGQWMAPEAASSVGVKGFKVNDIITFTEKYIGHDEGISNPDQLAIVDIPSNAKIVGNTRKPIKKEDVQDITKVIKADVALGLSIDDNKKYALEEQTKNTRGKIIALSEAYPIMLKIEDKDKQDDNGKHPIYDTVYQYANYQIATVELEDGTKTRIPVYADSKPGLTHPYNQFNANLQGSNGIIPKIAFGYVNNVHKAQGITNKNSYVDFSNMIANNMYEFLKKKDDQAESFLKGLYVGISRPTTSLTLVMNTDKKIFNESFAKILNKMNCQG